MTPQATKATRPRVFYVSYDGIGEPLGRSQVLAYLARLSADYALTLVSFEKPDADRHALSAELAALGIEWRPLGYHRRPPVLSTLLDVVAGVRQLRAASRTGHPTIVHVRSYVPALIALLAQRWTGGRLLFDIRGFWADERTEGGIWPEGGTLYRIAKRCERWFFAEADAVVTLTHASVPQVRQWVGDRDIPIVVIPTCTDVGRFAGASARESGPHAIWCGSIGTWYRFDLVPALARALGLELDVITRQTVQALEFLDGAPALVRSLAPSEVPGAMHAGDIGLCLCKASFSKIASAPTRFAEHLAAGMPVIVTRGIGDLEMLVEQHRVGVVLRSEDQIGLEDAARQALALALDPETAERCRGLARALFDVDAGASRYSELYMQLQPTG